MKELWDKYRDKAVTFFILTILLLVIISVVAVFGGAIMKVFGFEYDSVWSIILYFIIVALISFPFDLLVDALPRVLLSLGKVTKPMAVAVYLVLDIMLSYIGFSMIDYFMDSVSATDVSILILAVLFSLIGVKDIDEKFKEI